MKRLMNKSGVAGIFLVGLVLLAGSSSVLIYKDFTSGNGFSKVEKSGLNVSSEQASAYWRP